MAITIEEVEPVGTGQSNTTGRLIRGWLKRPKPAGPICLRCDGTGQDDRLERWERLPPQSHPGKAAALDRLKDALARWHRAYPEIMWSEPWVKPLEDFIERHEKAVVVRP